MATTSTELINEALSFIGVKGIGDIDDTQEEARQCKRFYEQGRRILLAEFNFGFNSRKEKLAPFKFLKEEEKDVLGDWDYCYDYPPKALRIEYLYNSENKGFMELKQQIEFEIATISENIKGIFTDLPRAYVNYLYDIEEVSVFSPNFTEVLQHKLASDVAIVLTGSSQTQQKEFQLYKEALERAKTQAVRERRFQMKHSSIYLKSRRF